jgi:SAM-dependent methyltransferase
MMPDRLRRNPEVRNLVTWLQSHVLPHDWVYDGSYYDESVDLPAVRSAEIISASVMRDFMPKSMADVGCGTGAMLQAFQANGCEIVGFEKSKAALQICLDRKLNVREFDLESDTLGSERQLDVVISMEVAEHLPQKVDDRYLDLLTNLAPVVVFTAAPPGQGGTDHINEQPPEYWREKFGRRNFSMDSEVTDRWKQEWKESERVTHWYFANLMVFRKMPPGGL